MVAIVFVTSRKCTRENASLITDIQFYGPLPIFVLTASHQSTNKIQYVKRDIVHRIQVSQVFANIDHSLKLFTRHVLRLLQRLLHSKHKATTYSLLCRWIAILLKGRIINRAATAIQSIILRLISIFILIKLGIQVSEGIISTGIKVRILGAQFSVVTITRSLHG